MNPRRAKEILGISEDDDEETVKRKYRAKILQFHPDKNKDPDAAERFREVHAAYSLLKDSESDEDYTKSYDDLMSEFLSAIFEARTPGGFAAKIIKIAIDRLIEAGQEYLCRLNRPLLAVLFKILSKYRASFHLPDELFEKMEELLANGLEEYIVLNPTLEDLLSAENIYKLKYEDKTYLVPLWHHDMVFDCSGRELLVKCFPILPDNMELDECNVLTVRLEYSVAEIWNRAEVDVCIGNKMYQFDGRTLKMTSDTQQIVLLGCGVPYNNTLDIFDCGTRQNIVLDIWVEF
jgi:hypothetical protein